MAEAAVKSVKNILRKSSDSNADPRAMLYAWNNVPRSDGYSPAQLLFGRRQRTNLPLLPFQNSPINFNEAASAKDAIHSSSTSFHDLHKKNLPSFSPGQSVLIQDPKSLLWDSTGVVVSVRPDNLSYVISNADRQFVRPRRLLRLCTLCLLYTSPSPRDLSTSRMPSSA